MLTGNLKHVLFLLFSWLWLVAYAKTDSTLCSAAYFVMFLGIFVNLMRSQRGQVEDTSLWVQVLL